MSFLFLIITDSCLLIGEKRNRLLYFLDRVSHGIESLSIDPDTLLDHRDSNTLYQNNESPYQSEMETVSSTESLRRKQKSRVIGNRKVFSCRSIYRISIKTEDYVRTVYKNRESISEGKVYHRFERRNTNHCISMRRVSRLGSGKRDYGCSLGFS